MYFFLFIGNVPRLFCSGTPHDQRFAPPRLPPLAAAHDAEWDAIHPFLPPYQGRGRPSDKRKTINAVFWIAASRGPWHALPSHLGSGESVARTLRRWARAGWLDRLLVAISDHPLAGGCDTLRRLGWFICRAFRRMARILDDASVMLAERLGLFHAWPAPVLRWPDPDLAQRASDVFRAAGEGATARPLSLARIGRALKAYGLCMKVMRWAEGNRRDWRLA